MKLFVHTRDAQVAATDHFAGCIGQSHAAIVDDLNCYQQDPVENGFGLWGKGKVDSLAYQENLRSEWPI